MEHKYIYLYGVALLAQVVACNCLQGRVEMFSSLLHAQTYPVFCVGNNKRLASQADKMDTFFQWDAGVCLVLLDVICSHWESLLHVCAKYDLAEYFSRNWHA